MATVYTGSKQDLPNRSENDYYRTELALIGTVLDGLPPEYTTPSSLTLDPASGDGRWGLECKHRFGASGKLVGVELDAKWEKPEGFDHWLTGDFMRLPVDAIGKFDRIATNPPYGPQIHGRKKVQNIFSENGWPYIQQERVTLSELFVRRGLDMLAASGTMIYLMDIQMQSGIDRHRSLWRDMAPEYVYVSSRRPSFYGSGTNGSDFGVFLWRKDASGKLINKPNEWITRTFYYERTKESE